MDEMDRENSPPPVNESIHTQKESSSEPYQKKLQGREPNHYAPLNSESWLSPQLSKTPVIVVGSLVGLLLATIAWGYLAPKSAVTFGSTVDTEKKPEPGRAETVIANAPNTVAVQAAQPELPKEDALIPSANSSARLETQNAAVMTSPANAGSSTMDYQDQAQIQMAMQREQEAGQREAARQAHLKEVKEASSTVFSNPQEQRNQQANISENLVQTASNPSADIAPLQGHLNRFNATAYLPHTRMPTISPYEVKAGTVIPSLMLSGINSDLPGQLIAQVVQNVYDSATGKYLLIPQGAKLVGSYDQGVVVGQHRVLIVWNRIIYPDSSSLELEAMSGQDQSGYAGFKDGVNNHVWPAFRQALLLSAVTAGVQLSQPRAQKGDYSYSSQQVVAGSLGMQLNQLGMASYQGRSNLAPTITIRPGYRFNIMVNKDMILPPWQARVNTISRV